MKLKKLNLLFGLVLCIFFNLLILSSIYPTSLQPDRGIFESVAYRVIAGDKLYTQVWDNKDPIFYYLNALVLSINPIFDLHLELILFLGISIVLYKINENITKSKLANIAFSFFVSPLLIINFGYSAGYTHLPGILIIFLILYSLLKNKVLIVAFLLALILFTKILFFPMALVMIFLKYKKSYVNFFKIFKYFLIFLLLFNLLFIIRGDFFGYYKSLYLNYKYASANRELLTGFQDIFMFKNLIVILLILIFISKIKNNKNYIKFYLYQVTLGTLIFGIIILILTGKFNHHIQILTPSIVLAFSIFSLAQLKNKFLTYAIIFTLFTVLFWQNNLINFQKNWNYIKWVYANDINVSPEANLLLKQSQIGDYARLGQNDDNAHAKNLTKWRLICPRFHQYPFENIHILKGSLDCIKKADYLIISPTFKTYAGLVEWNKFVTMGNEIVSQRFRCEFDSSTRICRNIKKGS